MLLLGVSGEMNTCFRVDDVFGGTVLVFRSCLHWHFKHSASALPILRSGECSSEKVRSLASPPPRKKKKKKNELVFVSCSHVAWWLVWSGFGVRVLIYGPRPEPGCEFLGVIREPGSLAPAGHIGGGRPAGDQDSAQGEGITSLVVIGVRYNFTFFRFQY